VKINAEGPHIQVWRDQRALIVGHTPFVVSDGGPDFKVALS
jgi:hypothetical protein